MTAMDRWQTAVSRRLGSNTLAMYVYNVGSVGFSTALALFVARRLGAEGLGKYAVLVAYLQVFQVFAGAGASYLIVREMARRQQARRHWFQSAVVMYAGSAVAGAVVLNVLAHVLRMPVDTARALSTVSVALLPSAVSLSLESVFRAMERMWLIPLVQVSAKGVQLAGSIAALLSGHGVVSIAWMFVLGQVLAAVAEMSLARPLHLWREFHVDWREAWSLLRRAGDFVMLTLLVVLYTRMGTLVLSQTAGEEATGLYSAAHLVIRVIHFLSASYSEAVYPLLSRLFVHDRPRFETIIQHSLLVGLTVTLMVTLVVLAAAEPIVHLLYQGQEYSVSVLLLRIEALLIAILMLNAVLSKGLVAGDLQRRSLVVSGVKLLAGILYYWVLTTRMGLAGAALAAVLAGLTGMVLNWLYVTKNVCRLNPSTFLKPIVIAGLVFAVMIGARGVGWPWLALGGASLYGVLLCAFGVFSLQDARFLRLLIWPD